MACSSCLTLVEEGGRNLSSGRRGKDDAAGFSPAYPEKRFGREPKAQLTVDNAIDEPNLLAAQAASKGLCSE
jgi:hypothetical protein